jgi:hypothetical protein
VAGLTAAFSIAAEGTTTITFYATDSAGNAEAPQTKTLMLDKTPPHTTAGLSGATHGCGAYIAPVQVTLTATDSGSGVASTVYKLDGGPLIAYAGPFTVSTVGSHTVTFHSTDRAGNVEATQSAKFTVSPDVSTPATTRCASTNVIWASGAAIPQAHIVGAGIVAGDKLLPLDATTTPPVLIGTPG